MRMSLTTTCGVSVLSAASASWAEEKVLNAMFSRVSAFSKTQRIERSSSMIHTGFMSASTLPDRSAQLFAHGQKDREKSRARRAFERDRSLVLRNEILGEREPQSTAAFAARHER